MELSDSAASKLDALAETGNQRLERGDWKGAVAAWKQAFALLPAPREQWEAWTWLNASIGDAYRTGDQLEDAKSSLLDALNGPDGHMNPFILLRLGQTLVDLGERDAGVEYLLRAYMLDGADVFAEDGEPYLALLRERGLID